MKTQDSIYWVSDLVEDRGEAVAVLAPGHVAVVVGHVAQHNLLHLQGIGPEGLLVVAREEVPITPPEHIAPSWLGGLRDILFAIAI